MATFFAVSIDPSLSVTAAVANMEAESAGTFVYQLSFWQPVSVQNLFSMVSMSLWSAVAFVL